MIRYAGLLPNVPRSGLKFSASLDRCPWLQRAAHLIQNCELRGVQIIAILPSTSWRFDCLSFIHLVGTIGTLFRSPVVPNQSLQFSCSAVVVAQYRGDYRIHKMLCNPSLCHLGLEFPACSQHGWLVWPTELASAIGGMFPMALCGRSSL